MKFEIRYNTNNQYYWVLKAANGEPICWSESYTVKANALHSVSLVRTYAGTASVVDLA